MTKKGTNWKKMTQKHEKRIQHKNPQKGKFYNSNYKKAPECQDSLNIVKLP